MTDWIAVLRAVAVRLGYGPAETRIPIILAIAAGGAATELERQRDAAQGADPLHPDGRCTCGGGGGGSCEWCRSHCVDCGVRLAEPAAGEEGRICDGCLSQGAAAVAADRSAPAPASIYISPMSYAARARVILDWFMGGEYRDALSPEAISFIAWQVSEAVRERKAVTREVWAQRLADSAKERDTLRAQLAEREAELAALRSSERERKPLVDRALSTFVGGYFDLSAVRELLNHERARRAKEKL